MLIINGNERLYIKDFTAEEIRLGQFIVIIF